MGQSSPCSLLIHSLRNEGAVRLMKDPFIDSLFLAAKFDDEAFQLDDAEPSSLLGRKAIRPADNRASA